METPDIQKLPEPEPEEQLHIPPPSVDLLLFLLAQAKECAVKLGEMEDFPQELRRPLSQSILRIDEAGLWGSCLLPDPEEAAHIPPTQQPSDEGIWTPEPVVAGADGTVQPVRLVPATDDDNEAA